MSQAKYAKPDAHPPGKYVHYIVAKEFLEKKFKATAHEIAIWVWVGPQFGGINCYLDAPLHRNPERFTFDDWPSGNQDYLSHLQHCFFLQSALDAFHPKERFIGYQNLKERWSARCSEAEAIALIRAKAESGELDAVHPITGNTLGTPFGAIKYKRAPLEEGVFFLAIVEALEAECFPSDTSDLLLNTSPRPGAQLEAIDEAKFLSDEAQHDLSVNPCKPVSAAEIRRHFHVFKDEDANESWWRAKMRDAKRYGLVDCRVGEGKKGRGVGTLWRPAMVAGWLVERHAKGREGLSSNAARAALIKYPYCEEAANVLFPPDD